MRLRLWLWLLRLALRMFRPGLAYVEEYINPILIKHKVTVTIGGIHPMYQRVELPAVQGVPTLVVGRSGGLGGPNAAPGAGSGRASANAMASRTISSARDRVAATLSGVRMPCSRKRVSNRGIGSCRFQCSS